MHWIKAFWKWLTAPMPVDPTNPPEDPRGTAW